MKQTNPKKPHRIWILPSGLDPNYFSPSEAAFAFYTNSDDANRKLSEKFQKLQFRNPIRPGSTEAGFVLVNLDEGFKAVDIDLISRDDVKSFSFIIEDPDFKADFKMVDFDTLYSSEEIVNFHGQKLFVGQISRDIGVNFTLKSPTIQPMSSTRTWMRRAAISSKTWLIRRRWPDTDTLRVSGVSPGMSPG